MQAPEKPVVLLHFPVSQSLQSTRAVTPVWELFFPAGHFLQEFNEAAPVSSMYFPCGQLKHWSEAGVLTYVPIGHDKHWVLDMCSLAEVPASGRNLPASQDWQAEIDPAFALYFPLPQILQDSRDVPRVLELVPGGQSMHPEPWWRPSASLHFPFSQAVQLDSASAPVPSLNFPLPQLVQDAAPASFEYFPAPQSKHLSAELCSAADAPASSKCFPAAHETQLLAGPAASEVETLPAPQTIQSEADCER